MELATALSPLVFAELYQLLARSSVYEESLSARLAEIGLDHSWLYDAAEKYDQKWISLQAGWDLTDEAHALPNDHAVLASWLLAALHFRFISADLDGELRNAVNTRLYTEVDDAPAARPPAYRPAISSWQMGMVLGDNDPTLPLALAYLPRDKDVQAAYKGLVEHVLHLWKIDEPWPEMLGTSTLWRGTGLAEGIKPEAGSAQAAIAQLLRECRQTLPGHQAERLARHFTPITDRRNALSHVAELTGKPRFHELTAVADDWTKVQQTVFGVTHFVCSLAATELSSQSSGIVHDQFWTTLEYDIAIW